MPTTDIFTGLNDTDILAMQQDTQSRLNSFFKDTPTQFANPENITQPQAPKGLYGTVNPGENINIDKTSYDYNAAAYNSLIKKGRDQYPGNPKLPDLLIPQSETRRYTNQDFGFDVLRDNEDLYNTHQNAAWEFFGKSLFARLPLLTLSKLGTGVGYLLGLANPKNWFENNYISTASDNSFSKFFEGMEDKVKNEWLPIYQKSSARDMGFFERAFKDQTFWSGDAIDAGAFMASAIVPGFVASKLSLGAKLASTLGIGEGEAINAAGQYLNSAAGKFARYTDIGLTSAMNTASESMFEAKQVKDDVYKQLMATGQYTDQQAQNIAGEKARNSFLSNLAALSVSNLWESNLIFKALGKKAPIEGAADLATTALTEDYKAAKSLGKLGFYGKKALTGMLVEGFYEENIQQAIQRYNENTKNSDGNPFSYTGGVLNQMWKQTLDSLSGKDKENAMNIGMGALIGGLFGTATEILGKEYSKEHLHTKAAIDALNFAKNNWLKIQDIYSVDESGKLKTDYPKAAAVLFTQAANTNQLNAIETAKDPINRSIAQKQLFASLVSSHINNGSYNKLIDQLQDMKSWKAEDLVKLGFDPDSKQGVNQQVEEYKSLADQIQYIRNSVDKLNLGKDPAIAQFRREKAFDTAATHAIVNSELNKLSNQIRNVEARIDNSDGTDQLVNDLNIAKLRIESQKINIQNASQENKRKAEAKLKEYETNYGQLQKENEDNLKELKKDKDGFFYYKSEGKNTHPLVNELHGMNIKYATLANAMEDLTSEYDEIVGNDTYAKEKYEKSVEELKNYIQTIQKNSEKETKETTEEQKAATGTEEKPEILLNEKQQKVKDLKDKRDRDLDAATTKEERTRINKEHIQNVLALNKEDAPQITADVNAQNQRFVELSDRLATSKSLHVDDYNKIGAQINEESGKGNISEEHERLLLAQLDKKQVIGTIFDSSQDAEDETLDPDTEQAMAILQENVPGDDSIDQQTDTPTEDNPQIGEVFEGFNPDTNEVDDTNLDGDVFSYIAFKSSNKTVTQEEKTDENGVYNRQLDEDPYKQFKQGYLRFIDEQGMPENGISAKIIKDSDNLPHSEETKQYLAAGNSYGSVLVLTNKEGNILYFNSGYESSTENLEGYKPLVYSFNNIAWKDNEILRAIIGENRTGIPYENYLQQYEREQLQQKLARDLTNKGKEVPVTIKAITSGVVNKSKTPLQSSEVITNEFNSHLFIPPSPVDRFDPENPLKNKYVIVGNKALINGGLYAQIIDPKTNNISYSRLLPNKINEIGDLYKQVTNLLFHEYQDENEAQIAKEYLKSLLFLGTPKRPNLIVVNLDNGNSAIKFIQNNTTLNPELVSTFLETQRINIIRSNVDSDTFNIYDIVNGKLHVIQSTISYKQFILDHSTTRDLPIKTKEGEKFLGLNSYAIFDFMDSPETMNKNLQEEKELPVEQIVSFKDNDISVWSGNARDAQALGERLKRLNVRNIATMSSSKAIAEIAAKAAGIGVPNFNALLKEWDIAPDIDQSYFVINPDSTQNGDIKIGESFNDFIKRTIKGYEFFTKNGSKGTAIIVAPSVIKAWNAFIENNEQWNERASERYLNASDNVSFTAISIKPDVKSTNTNLTKAPLKRLGIIESKEDEVARIAREQDEKDKGLKAKTDTRENRPLLIQSEIEKVNTLFGSEVAQRVDEITNSDARALWTTSGIKLYRDARVGDGYHEAWHHFSQLYLTLGEKRSLYDEARKKGINFVDRDGNKLNSKTASDFQLEEMIADDFRDYVESDGKSRLVERPYRNNIFRRILDFIKKFFFGDINVSKLYDDLYRGNLNHYTPSFNNAMWGKLNSKAMNQKGEEIVNNQKAAYYRGVVDYFMGDQLMKANTSVDQLRRNKALAEAIYKNIYNELVTKYYNPLLDKADAGEDIDQSIAEDLFNILTNWEDFVQYHKESSKLFLNIPHELAIDVPSDPSNLTDVAELAGDNEEIGEYNSEMMDDEPEEYEAIFSDKIYDKAGNEQSSMEAASIETKGLIRMLPEIKYDNGNFSVALDIHGFPKLCDYARTWNNLAFELSNLSKYEEMYNKMSDPQVMKKIPELSALLKHLPDPAKEHTPAEMKTIIAFRTDFNRAYVGIYSGKIIPNADGSVLYYFNEETKRNRDQVQSLWTANFYNKLSTDPDVQSGKLLIDDQTGKYYLNPSIPLRYNMSTETGREDFLKLIGFSFSDETRKQSFYKSHLGQYLKSIQDNINIRQLSGQRIYNPVFDLRSDLRDVSSKSVIAPGMSKTINGLLYLEAKFTTDVPSLSYQTSEGEMIYGLTLNHTLSIIANRLNQATSYSDIINDPALQHLNFLNNPYVQGSIFLEGLFNVNSGKRLKNNIIVGNYNGLKGQDKNNNTVGYSTTNLNVRQKAIFDINSLLSSGAVEVMRTESSSSSYFIKLQMYTRDQTDPSREYLPVGISEFTTSFNSPRFKSIMIDNYLYDELNRMKMADTVETYKKDPKLMSAAKSFNLFADILPYFRSTDKADEGLKDKLKEYIDKMSVTDLIEKYRANIDKAIENFFAREFKSFNDLLSEENINSSEIGTNMEGKSFDQKIRAFLANDFILNVEYTKLFNGDTIYQVHYKDYFKRSKGDISTGKSPITDELFARFMKKTENQTFAGFIGSLVENDYKTTRTINFIDDERASKYVDIYKKDLRAVNPKLTDEEIEKYIGKYNNLNIGDGQGWITLDFYRQFLRSINNWSDAQEMMYKVELAKWRLAHANFNPNYTNEMKQIDREFLRNNPYTYSYFPPLKIQYNGPIKAEGTYAPTMDKFSVAPLIPSIIQDTPLEDVHNQMLKHGVGYAKFLSGTKKYKAPAYALYNENEHVSVDFTKATLPTHFLDYLKEQINTNPKIKQESIFGSQVRKLIEANIFSNGITTEEDLKRHERYVGLIKGIVELGKEDLFKELSLKEEGGKIYVSDMEKFISTLQNQADLRDLNDNITDYIQYDKDTKKMVFPLETSLNRRAIQDLIMGIIDRKLRVQKLSGDQLIQISSSGFQSKDFKYTNPTEEEIKKYGTNGLRFYHLEYDENGKPIRTKAAQVKVALIGGFEKLLEKIHPDGTKIKTLERLNQLLKNDDWIAENRKSISLVGYRIPTQGHNSIENLEVAEFLPPHAGSVVIVPAEIVAKAGSDFDIDKLSIFRPSFDDDGNLIDNKSKEGYANKIIELFSEILSDPRTFEKLIRPNDTDLVKGEINQIAVDIGKRNARDIKEALPYQRTQIYRYKNNLRKFETLLSAKKLLAIFAVNNTFTTLLQQAGITMGNTYQLSNSNVVREVRMMLLSPEERERAFLDGRINLSSKYSADGTIKQDILNQLINATVDAASDDFFGYVNASFENVNVLCHLINQGVPFNRAMRFLNQPVLLRYYSDLRRKNQFDSKMDIQARILGQLTDTNFYYQNDEGFLKLDRKAFHIKINEILNSPTGRKIYLSEEALKKTTVKNWQVDNFLGLEKAKSYNAIMFAYFISLQEQAQLFRNFQTLLNFDTTKIRSPLSVWQAFDAIQNLRVNRMFDQEQFTKMLNKSVIAPFENRKLVATIGYQLMPVAFHPWFAKEITPIINKLIAFKNKSLQKKILANVENQWIEYAVKSMSRIEGKELQLFGKYLLEGPNNLARRFNDLISKYPELKTDYAFVARIRPNFPNRADVKKANLEVHRLFENSTDDQNRYIGEFRELINISDTNKYTPSELEEIRKFFSDLAVLAFFQSGFSKSNISFQELVPYEQLADTFKTAIKNIMTYIASDSKLMVDYVKEFIQQYGNNNSERNIQSWRGRDYYLSKPLAEKLTKKVGTVNVIKNQVQIEAKPAPYENVIKQPEVQTEPLPEIKTPRQYWPGDEREGKGEVQEAVGKAEFKFMMDKLQKSRIDFNDVFDTYKGKDNGFIVTDEYDTERLTPEKFERFWKLYEKFGDDIIPDYANLTELEEELKSITNDEYDIIYPSLSKALEAYSNDEVPDNQLEQVEQLLSEYGLMRYKFVDQFNPAQLRLPFTANEEQYNNQINQVLKDKDRC